MAEFLLFALEGRRFAIPLENVLRVERMVSITPLAEMPPLQSGVVNVRGRTVPVLDLRPVHGLSIRPPRLSDQLLLIGMGEEMAALHIDAAEEVFTLGPEEKITAEGTITVSGEIVPVHRPEQLIGKTKGAAQ